MRDLLAIRLLLPVLLLALPLAGQQNPDHAAIAIAAASALRADTELPEGPTGFIAAAGMEEAAREAARVMGGHVTTIEEAVRCGKLPSSCELVDAVVLIRVRAPSISGDTAQAVATVWWETGLARVPVAIKTVALTLRRNDGGWVVTGQQLQEIT